MNNLCQRLKVELNDAIQVSQVYGVVPLQPAFPYIFLTTIKNTKWENLLNQGIKSHILCEYHMQEKNMHKMLETINTIKNVITNEKLVIIIPEIIYLHFTNYEIKQYKAELVAMIYFEVIIKIYLG